MNEFIANTELSAADVAGRTREIYQTMLRESGYIDSANFTLIHPRDVERLFDLYDAAFFEGRCRQELGRRPLRFRLSKRMTSAGGTTSRFGLPDPNRVTVYGERFEIAIATSLLFQTFREDHRPVVMSGIECRDRLEALQRVVEHEMVHLIELLIWRESSCFVGRFQSIARRFFAHTDHRHQLITPREQAYTKFGVQAGQRVAFRFEGRQLVGRVNRITKRATVLVEDPNGRRYSDGKHYAKFYIPAAMLTVIGAEASHTNVERSTSPS